MSWVERNWLKVLFVAVALNFCVLLYMPHWLGARLGCAINLPDLNPLITSEDANALKKCLKGQGQIGVDLFGQWHTFGADLIFPALLAAALTFGILHFVNQSARSSKYPFSLRLALCGLMPLAYAVCDYAENAMVWNWLISSQVDIKTTKIAVATTLKFIFVTIALAIFIMFALAKLKRRHNS
jgi:hypothetical protein